MGFTCLCLAVCILCLIEMGRAINLRRSLVNGVWWICFAFIRMINVKFTEENCDDGVAVMVFLLFTSRNSDWMCFVGRKFMFMIIEQFNWWQQNSINTTKPIAFRNVQLASNNWFICMSKSIVCIKYIQRNISTCHVLCDYFVCLPTK